MNLALIKLGFDFNLNLLSRYAMGNYLNTLKTSMTFSIINNSPVVTSAKFTIKPIIFFIELGSRILFNELIRPITDKIIMIRLNKPIMVENIGFALLRYDAIKILQTNTTFKIAILNDFKMLLCRIAFICYLLRLITVL
ncbi:MAG: hypothetical protein WC716_13090 [Chitinophagaceae bacterium]